MGDSDESFEGIGAPADDAASALENIDIINVDAMDAAVDAMISAAVSAREQELSGTQGSIVGDSVNSEDFAWLKEHFKRFYDRPLGAGVKIASGITRTREIMEEGSSSVFSEASAALNGWTGDARDHYQSYFVNKFPGAMKNQLTILEGMRAGAIAYEAIQRSGRADAKEIAEAATGALDAIGGSDAAGPEARFTYTMIGVTAWILGSAISAGTLTPVLGLTLIGAGSFAAGGAASYSKANDVVEGSTVQEVLDQTIGYLNDLQNNMFEEESLLAGAFSDDTGWVEGKLGHSDWDSKAAILPHEPDDGPVNLTDGDVPPPEDFRPKE